MTVLRKLWQEKHPTGNIWIETSTGLLLDCGKQTGKFKVTYSDSDSKPYVYSASSVYKLAERLNLIPNSEIDYWQESRNCIDALNSGLRFSTIAGIYDTMVSIDPSKSFGRGLKIAQSVDEFDRVVFTFYI